MSQANQNIPANIKEANIDGFLKKEYFYRFSIDAWATDPHLKENTFPTSILPLSCAEGRAILKLHESIYHQHPLSSDDLSNLKSIEDRIDESIREFGGAAFVKLNHRSPKDVVLYKSNDKLRRELFSRLSKISSDDKRKQATAWLEAANQNSKKYLQEVNL